MSSKPPRGAAWWFYVWSPVILSVAAVFLESTEMFGSNHTNGPLHRLVVFLLGPIDDARWDTIHHYLRKSGHFLGYGLIGLAWLRAWWLTLPQSRFLPDAFLALLGTALVASCDEWHQTFLPNRTGTPWDVLLDCTGAIALQILVYAFMRTFRPKRLARAA